MWQRISKLWQWLRQHPWWTALGGVVLAVAGVLLAADIWALSHFRAAQQSLQEEKYADASAHLKQCQRIWWRRTADTYLLAARLERLQGHDDKIHYQEAAKLLEKTKQLFGGGEAAQFEVMLLQAETGAIADVEKDLWAMVQKKSQKDTQQIFRALAKGYAQSWRYVMALKVLDLWVVSSPNSAEALEWRGILWQQLNNNSNAQADFRKALAKAPHRRKARFQLVKQLLATDGGPAEILNHLQMLLQEEPHRPDYLVALAQCQTLQGDFPAARQTLDQVLKLKADEASAMYVRAQLELQDKQFVAAEKWARKALKQDQTGFQAYLTLADSLKLQDDPQKAKEAEIQLEKYESAKKDVDRLQELLGDDSEQQKNQPGVLAEIGGILLRSHQEKAGLQWIDKALKLSPNNHSAHNLLAAYYETKNQPKLAAKHRELANAGSPK